MTASVPVLVEQIEAFELLERNMASERLRVAIGIQRFLDAGGHLEFGYARPWQWLLAEVCPKLGWDRGKMARVLMAARELPNVIPFRGGNFSPSIKTLSMLNTERKRQARGRGRVSPKVFREVERRIVRGHMSKREVGKLFRAAA